MRAHNYNSQYIKSFDRESAEIHSFIRRKWFDAMLRQIEKQQAEKWNVCERDWGKTCFIVGRVHDATWKSNYNIFYPSSCRLSFGAFVGN